MLDHFQVQFVVFFYLLTYLTLNCLAVGTWLFHQTQNIIENMIYAVYLHGMGELRQLHLPLIAYIRVVYFIKAGDRLQPARVSTIYDLKFGCGFAIRAFLPFYPLLALAFKRYLYQYPCLFAFTILEHRKFQIVGILVLFEILFKGILLSEHDHWSIDILLAHFLFGVVAFHFIKQIKLTLDVALISKKSLTFSLPLESKHLHLLHLALLSLQLAVDDFLRFAAKLLKKIRLRIANNINTFLNDIIFLLDCPQCVIDLRKIAHHHPLHVDLPHTLKHDIAAVIVSECFYLLLFFLKLLSGAAGVRLDPLVLNPYHQGLCHLHLPLQRL